MLLNRRFLYVAGLIFLLNGLYFKKEAFVCELIVLSAFDQVSPSIYVDKTVTKNQRLALLSSINDAISRVTDTYGLPTSTPRFIVSTDEYYANFGFNLTGMQTSSFVRECIFLGPKGLNTDVIAHEYVHAEVRHRVGVLTELLELPAWFIEGTAIMVDNRKPFLSENIQVTALEIQNIKKVFYLKDFPNTSVHHYQASKAAVEQLDITSLYLDLARLDNGESFNVVFGSN